MVSLSSFREAEPTRYRKLGLTVAAGMVPAMLTLGPQAVSAQEQGVETAPVEPAPVVSPVEPEPAPVPITLDDLIPESAVNAAESWAANGVDSPTTTPAEIEDPFADQFADFDPFGSPATGPVTGPGLDTTLDNFALDLAEPLPVDPEVEALAELDVTELLNLPELTEYRVTDTLQLGFPADPAAFPEREEFVERFRQLSTVRELDDDQDTIAQVAARARADEELLVEILRTYGYYDGNVVRQLSGGRRNLENGAADADDVSAEPQLRFDILPGPRYVFGRVDLGSLASLPQPDLATFRDTFGIREGDPLYADRIVDQEISLRVALGESGYPFARFDQPELLIDHARREGDLSLQVQPGGKYAFGEVFSSDPSFLPGKHLQRIARFDRGDIYQQSLETDLRRAILATGLVSSVSITKRETAPPTEAEPGQVALDVEFDRAPLRTIAGAVGYGTEDGLKVEARWEHRNLFPPEGALRLRGILGTREALASVGFRRNNFLGRDQVLTVDIFASDITTLAVDARSIGVRGSFEKVSNILFQKDFSWQAGAEVLYSDERNRSNRIAPGEPVPRRAFQIAGLFGSATLDESDDLLDPSSGWRATLFLAPEASRSEGTEEFYLRAQADASYYLPVGDNVIAGRVRAATIQGAVVDNVAPSRRLYAGGGGSVRGYGFQGVGPRDQDGQATGGASLIEFSLEGRIQTPLFDGAVEVVPFIDAGTVGRGSTPDFDNIQFGAGIGLRYKTSFGPIRIDVATPLNPNEFDSPVVVYVSLGQAF